MSNIVFAAIMPHGDYIPALGGPNPPLMVKTHRAALDIARKIKQTKPDTIVIATPHGTIVDGYICVSATERAIGTLHGHAANIIADIQIDQAFSEQLCDSSEAVGLPIARYVANDQGESVLPLDWGVIIPLWYCELESQPTPTYKFVIVAPPKSVHSSSLMQFGEQIARVAGQTGKRVAYIASCDWAHAHSPTGPYGFHPDAKRLDHEVKRIISSNNLEALSHLDSKMVENALADGIPQALILQGAAKEANVSSKVLSYECPTYFGMLVASFTRPS